jgi:hypothetical protein
VSTFTRPRSKKSTAVTTLPNGAMQINFPVEGKWFFCTGIITRSLTRLPSGPVQQPSPEKRPIRKRRMTRKVTEDATADVPATDSPSRPHSRRRQEDPVVCNPDLPAPSASDIPSDRQANNEAISPHPNPVHDYGANPFLVAADPPKTPPPNPASTPSTEARFNAVSPSTPSRSPKTPQVGHHSIHQSVVRHRELLDNGPAGHKHRYSARDIWTFFEQDDSVSKNTCLFCK